MFLAELIKFRVKFLFLCAAGRQNFINLAAFNRCAEQNAIIGAKLREGEMIFDKLMGAWRKTAGRYGVEMKFARRGANFWAADLKI